ncbi:hypothetical protein [Novosphingobium sp. CECT 9465]|nr:hypothetical protein [Novosphingobium sp. CECT 9465]
MIDLPSGYPPSSDQVIEQKLLDCGLNSGAFDRLLLRDSKMGPRTVLLPA